MNLKMSELDANIIKDEVVRRILHNDDDHVKKDGSLYHVVVNNLTFTCSYSDDEIKDIASLCLELLEELRNINENGYTRKELEKAQQVHDDKQIVGTMDIYKSFATAKIEDIVKRLGETTRVGGSFYIIVARPVFIRGIYVVFDLIIDNFENAELYFSALYLLIRIAMYMHGSEIV